MQNKRGISQAFSGPTGQDGILIRKATVFDVFGISRVLVASITDLCVADHGNEPDKLLPWLANKTPADIQGWITAGSPLLATEQSGEISAVALALEDGFISLLYVAPKAVGQGLGRALLQKMERQLAEQGHHEAHLISTRSALNFYLSQGWSRTAPATECLGLPAHPMRKLLQAPG